MTIRFPRPCSSLLALALTLTCAGQLGAQITGELDDFWAEVSRTVAEGDFDGYAATYHPDAVVIFGMETQLSGFSLFGVAMDPTSGYATYSLVIQTLVALAVFALWWRWMNRHRPIANRDAAA